jgi:hypothetical protein
MTTPIVANLPPPPQRVKPFDQQGNMATEWYKWFQLLWQRAGGSSGSDIYLPLVLSNTLAASEPQLFAIQQNLQDQLDDVLVNFTPTNYPIEELFPEDFNWSGILQAAIDNSVVKSVFGRTGNIIAVEGDYSLDLLSDMTITTPTANQLLTYNGSGWVNSSTVPVLTVGTIINLPQATTVGAPAYVLGGMYFDTTLNKLRIGGATAWETVTSI